MKSNTLVHNYLQCIGLLDPRQRRDYWFVVGFKTLAALMELIGIAAIIPIISTLVDYESSIANKQLALIHEFLGSPKKTTFLAILALSATGLVWLSGITTGLAIFTSNRFVKRISANLAIRVYRQYMRQPIDQFYERPSSVFMRNVNGISDQVAQGVIGNSITIIARCVQIVFIITMLLTVSFNVTLTIMIVILGAYLGIYFLVRRRILRMSVENLDENRRLQQLIIGSYQAYRSIFINNLLHSFESHFKELKSSASRKAADMQIISASPKEIIEVAGITLLLLASFTIGVSTENSHEFVTIMALFGIATYRVLPAAQQVYHGINRLTAASAVYEKVSAEWGKLGNRGSLPTSPPTTISKPRLLSARSVSYSYADKPVFTNLDFDIELLGIVRIVGESGAGKSTLMDILTGLREPDSGQIFIDNQPLSEVGQQAWWQNISYQSQADYVFQGSLEENIAFDAQNADQGKLELIAGICELGSLCKDGKFCPNQEVSEGGTNLSGGQKNRLLLARALYKESHLVFLDEAFSALDLVSSQEIIEKMLESFPDRCFLVISHRSTEFSRSQIQKIVCV